MGSSLDCITIGWISAKNLEALILIHLNRECFSPFVSEASEIGEIGDLFGFFFTFIIYFWRLLHLRFFL